ncbi:MAG: glycosyltransferase family 4 protein [Euryarchaeota archaeon]|nr:glycosyltransferase family 4 protein [Euryarchaeota archaeon]
MTDRTGELLTEAANPAETSQSEQTRVFWPFFIGTDNPISYLYQQIAPKFDAGEFDITVLASGGDGQLEADNVRTIPAAEFYTWAGRLTLARHAIESYDLLHTGGIPALHYPVALLARLRNPTATHVHTYRIDADPDSDRTPTALRRRLGRRATITTAVSEHTAGTVRSTFGLDPVVIYNAVDTAQFHPDYERPPLLERYGADRPVFVFVGSFERRKHPLDVISVAKQVPEATFLLIGGGGTQDRDELVADRAANVDNAHVVGRVPKDRLPGVYANADGLLFPSTMEGCPNVVLEAFASGTPVVGYNATSMPELVVDGQRGYLADSGDVRGLVDGVRSVIADSTNRLGDNARGYVHRNHTFETVAQQYADVYRTALGD